MKRLRSGFTTGACAAAAAKGAVILLLGKNQIDSVEIPFPDDRRISFELSQCHWLDIRESIACCSVIKDAGDDPDVTNGAEIVATVSLEPFSETGKQVQILGGVGVGIITKPGLALPVGAPAINPTPLKMIDTAVREAISSLHYDCSGSSIVVRISVPNGEVLAKKTLNSRLGIHGGLSILGTTGVVVPVSADAWTATISASMDVARECGIQEIVLSTGRTSERVVEEHLRFPEEAYVMMGDYLQFAINEASLKGFRKIHLAGMWAKILKGAMRTPQTHVRHGILEVEKAIAFIQSLDHQDNCLNFLYGANTAREIYERLMDQGRQDLVLTACQEAKKYYQTTSGLPVDVYLVHASGKIVASA